MLCKIVVLSITLIDYMPIILYNFCVKECGNKIIKSIICENIFCLNILSYHELFFHFLFFARPPENKNRKTGNPVFR